MFWQLIFCNKLNLFKGTVFIIGYIIVIISDFDHFPPLILRGLMTTTGIDKQTVLKQLRFADVRSGKQDTTTF